MKKCNVITIVILFVFLLASMSVILNSAVGKATVLTQQITELKPYKDIYERIKTISKILSAYPLYGIEPYVYAVALDSVARKYGIEWEAVASTIDIETGRTWLPNQTSSADCKGILQLKESTAEMMAKEADIPYHDNITVWMEVRAIELGSRYLAKGLKEYGYYNGFKYYVGGSNFGNTEGAAEKLTVAQRKMKKHEKVIKNAWYIKYYADITSREYRKLRMMSGAKQ